VEPDHALAAAVGLTAARRLATRYGADYVRNIPRCVDGLRRLRNTEIRRRHDEDGESAAMLARAFALTERQIWSILAESRDNSIERQPALF
jgi:Mor family transcriptional regulator